MPGYPTRPSRRRITVPLAATLALSLVGALAACGSTASGSSTHKDVVNAQGKSVSADQKLHDMLPAQIKSSGVIRFATDVPYPPFEMFTAPGSQQITGLDYDLGTAIATKLGVKAEFKEQKFDGIIPAIQAGQYDAVMSAMTDNKKREAVLDFVDYSVSGTGILVAKGNPKNIHSLKDLCGLPVAVQSGTHQVDLIAQHQSDCTANKIQVQTYPKDSDAQLAVKSGKAVADVMDKPAAGYTAKTAAGGNAFESVDDPSVQGGYDATPNGIGVSKKVPGLATAIQAALQALIDDGTYSTILANYGQEGIAVSSATLNRALS